MQPVFPTGRRPANVLADKMKVWLHRGFIVLLAATLALVVAAESVPLSLPGSAYAIIWMMSRRHLAATVAAPAVAKYAPRPFNRWHTIKGLAILVLVIAFFFRPCPRKSSR